MRHRLMRILAACLLAAWAASGCGPRARSWGTTLAWGRDVAVGWLDGKPVGPLAAAAAPGRVVVADSFAGRLLVWRCRQGRWTGPEVRDLPAGGPIVGVALYPAGQAEAILAADGTGGVWALPAAGPARRLVQLRSTPGDLQRIVGLAVAPDGTPVVEVVEVTAQRSSRTVYAVGPDGALKALVSAEVGRAGAGAGEQGGRWLSPAGVRSTLAPARQGGVWLAVRGAVGSPGELVRLGPGGVWADARPLPAGLPRPLDFLGLDRGGLAYLLVSGSQPRIVAVDRTGRIRRTYGLPPPGPGPRLPHPAALSPDGSLLTLRAADAGLEVRWWPPGGGPAPGRK